MMRILGIDPGYAIMGYGVLDYNGNRFKTVGYGSVETEAGLPMPERLKLLYDGLTEIIQKYEPDEVSIEELFFNRNVTTAIGVGEARGVAMLACVEGGLVVSEYTPMQIKQALVGYGKAEKAQVQMMVKTILNLPEVPKPDDTADAVAAAICHAHSRNARGLGR
nr:MULTISPECIES: crossover junction endodeoxyribonuclease RuvC [Mogibacterium]